MELNLFNSLLKKIEKYPRLSFLILGALGILGYSPFFFFPATIISFSLLLFLMNREPFERRPFYYGFIFSYGHFLAGTYWIANSFNVYGLWYVMPFIWILLPAFLALFQALGLWFVIKLVRHPLARVLLFAAFWSALEYIKGVYILGGFPWNLSGYIWGTSILQMTSIIGIYGLSLLTTLLLCSLASRSAIFVFSCTTLFLIFFIYGEGQLQQSTTQRSGINIRLVQASIPQNFKWLSERFVENFNRHLDLSALEGERPLNIIIWPEASIPTFVADYPNIRQALAEVTPPNGYIIVGGPRHDINGETRIYTSLFALNNRGEILETYDKTHLVPFGEYMPLREFLPFGKLTPGETDYSPGKALKTINLPGIPGFTPLVCFEAIFPGQVIPTTPNKRPSWLLNQTNDAWYGYSTGPYQHLQMVRVRAIEEGLPLVRSANNGISAVIDPYGRILSKLDLDYIGFIDAELPLPLPIPTLYSIYKNSFFLIFLCFLALCSIIIDRYKR